MIALVLTLFVSLILVVGAILLLGRSAQAGDFEQADRLSLLPLDEDEIRGDDTKGEPEPLATENGNEQGESV